MFRRMKICLYRAAIHAVMRRPSPHRIPMNGDGLHERNYHSAWLGDAGNRRRFLVQGIRSSGLSGLWFGANPAEPAPRDIPDAEIVDFNLAIDSYIREGQWLYTSPTDFILQDFFKVPWLKLALGRARQFLFNQRRLVRNSRMTMLQKIVDDSLGDYNFQTDPVTFGVVMHGPRLFGHPDNDAILRRYKLLIGWEFPRLCRGGSKRSTFPGVIPARRRSTVATSERLRIVSVG